MQRIVASLIANRSKEMQHIKCSTYNHNNFLLKPSSKSSTNSAKYALRGPTIMNVIKTFRSTRAYQPTLSPFLRQAFTVQCRSISSKEATEADVSVDLTKYAPKGDAWHRPQKWIVFSDLHVSLRTVPVCLDVLKTIHQHASQHKAGIIFLGDFWHMRGSLPVEPLNQVINVLKEWDTPALFLVGNHDQVSLGGMVHALTPLAAASDLIHVFDGPAKFRDALWLPYRREQSELERAVAEAGSVKAIFAHADIVGASMNDAIQAKDGLPQGIFPRGIPSYTGHYHKPHTVPGTDIRYVGSPYQVSRSEAGQQKHFLVLDENWQVVEEIPIDIGPKHYNVAVPSMYETALEPEEQVLLTEESLPANLQSGDRIRLTMPEDAMKKHKKLLTKLQKQGIQVELIAPPSVSTPRIAAAENLGPVELFTRYASMRGLSAAAIEKGVRLLQESPLTSSAAISQSSVDLSFRSVEVEGYFSFKDAVKYDLYKRGLVVVTGQVEGGSEVAGGVDSNGAGKTALVMAPLWAITGDVDTRSELGAGRGLTNTDVVNEDSKTARVSLEGTVNGTPFVIQRTAGRRGRGSSLTFQLGDEDRTTQEIRMTQADINQHLGAALLGRTVFYGQSEITALLESNDRAFKDELGKLVDLSVWEAAKESSKQEVAQRRLQFTSISNELSMVENYQQQFNQQLDISKQGSLEWNTEQSGREAEIKQRATSIATQLHHHSTSLQQAVVQLKEYLASMPFLDTIELNQDAASDNNIQQDASLDTKVLEAQLQTLRQQLLATRQKLGAANGLVASKTQAYEEYAALADTTTQMSYPNTLTTAAAVLAVGSASGAPTTHTHSDGNVVCDRCLQPIDLQTHADNCIRLEKDLEAAKQEALEAQNEVSSLQQAVDGAEQQVEEARTAQLKALSAENEQRAQAANASRKQEQEKQSIEAALQLASSYIDTLESTYNKLQGVCPADANVFGAPSSIIETAEDLIGFVNQLAYDAESSIRDAESVQRAWSFFQEERNPFEPEVQRLESLLQQQATAFEELEKKQGDLELELEAWKAVDEAFRPSGIVSFVLEGVLGALQEVSAVHLATLAPGVTLELAPCQPKKSDPEAVIERVERVVKVRPPDGSEPRIRSVRQLSGGERRRVALALALGFSELAGRKGRLHSDLLVLDEVMQHLDGEGCMRLATLLRQLPYASVLVVAQAHSFMTQAFDAVDVVVKDAGTSTVSIGADSA